MTSPLASQSASPAPVSPLQLDLEAPDKIARWRPLVHWLLVIPHFVVLYVLALVQNVIVIISFFAILATGAMPEGLFGFNVMVLRYQWRVTSYALYMRESYPAFEFPMESSDPGGDPAHLSMQPAPKLSRGLIFVKWLMAIPHYIVLIALNIALCVVMIVAFFTVLVTGQWPAGMRNFVVGVSRWGARVNAYVLLMTDQYPPFSLS